MKRFRGFGEISVRTGLNKKKYILFMFSVTFVSTACKCLRLLFSFTFAVLHMWSVSRQTHKKGNRQNNSSKPLFSRPTWGLPQTEKT